MNPWIGGMPWASVAPPGVPAIGAVAQYPAGGNAWSAQPSAALPAYSLFTPGPLAVNAPSALALNAMFNQRDNALLYVDAAIGPYGVLENLSAVGGNPIALGAPTTPLSSTVAGWAGTTVMVAGNAQSILNAAVATVVGDVMDLEFSGGMGFEANGAIVAGGVTGMGLGLGCKENGGAAIDLMDQGWSLAQAVAGTCVMSQGVSLRARRTVVTAGTFAVTINGCCYTSSGSFQAIGLYGPYTVTLKHLRPY
jgi:hypothetical protein